MAEEVIIDNQEVNKEGQQSNSVVPTLELTDDIMLAKFNEKFGTNHTSLEAFVTKPTPTAEDLQREKEERSTKITAWGFQTGKINETKYKDFIKETQSPEQIIFNDFLATKKAEDAEISADDVKYEFDEIVSKLGQNKIKEWAEVLLEKKYADVYSLEKEYTSYEQSQKAEQDFNAKLKAEAPRYIETNNAIINEILEKGIEFELPSTKEGETIKLKVNIDKDKAEKIRNHFTSDAEVRNAVANGYSKEKIEPLLKASLSTASINEIVAQVYSQAQLNKEALKRGIPQLVVNEKGNMVLGDRDEQLKQNEEIFRQAFGKTVPQAN